MIGDFGTVFITEKQSDQSITTDNNGFHTQQESYNL